MKSFTNSANFILFLLLWPAAVLGSVYGELVWLWLVLIAMVTVVYFSDKKFMTDLKLASSALVFGLFFESMAEHFGWLLFFDAQQINGWPPVWILVLWVGLGLTFRHSNAWLINKRVSWLMVWLACVPLTYISAARLGALVVNNWLFMYVAVLIGWSVYMLSVRLILNHKPRVRDVNGGRHA